MNYDGMREEIEAEFANLATGFELAESGFRVQKTAEKAAHCIAVWRAMNPLKVKAQQQRHAAVKAKSTAAWKAANHERVLEHRRRYREKKRQAARVVR